MCIRSLVPRHLHMQSCVIQCTRTNGLWPYGCLVKVTRWCVQLCRYCTPRKYTLRHSSRARAPKHMLSCDTPTCCTHFLFVMCEWRYLKSIMYVMWYTLNYAATVDSVVYNWRDYEMLHTNALYNNIMYYILIYCYRTSLCELGLRDPTKNLTSMVPKDQMSVLREIHSGRTSLQVMGKDVWRRGRTSQRRRHYKHTTLSYRRRDCTEWTSNNPTLQLKRTCADAGAQKWQNLKPTQWPTRHTPKHITYILTKHSHLAHE